MAKEYDFRGKLFYIDPSWQKTLRRLDILERAKIWDAIMDYRLNGVEVCLTGEISERAEGVYFDLDAHEWQGRWFTTTFVFDVKHLAIAPAPASAPASTPNVVYAKDVAQEGVLPH